MKVGIIIVLFLIFSHGLGCTRYMRTDGRNRMEFVCNRQPPPMAGMHHGMALDSVINCLLLMAIPDDRPKPVTTSEIEPVTTTEFFHVSIVHYPDDFLITRRKREVCPIPTGSVTVKISNDYVDVLTYQNQTLVSAWFDFRDDDTIAVEIRSVRAADNFMIDSHMRQRRSTGSALGQMEIELEVDTTIAADGLLQGFYFEENDKPTLVRLKREASPWRFPTPIKPKPIPTPVLNPITKPQVPPSASAQKPIQVQKQDDKNTKPIPQATDKPKQSIMAATEKPKNKPLAQDSKKKPTNMTKGSKDNPTGSTLNKDGKNNSTASTNVTVSQSATTKNSTHGTDEHKNRNNSPKPSNSSSTAKNVTSTNKETKNSTQILNNNADNSGPQSSSSSSGGSNTASGSSDASSSTHNTKSDGEKEKKHDSNDNKAAAGVDESPKKTTKTPRTKKSTTNPQQKNITTNASQDKPEKTNSRSSPTATKTTPNMSLKPVDTWDIIIKVMIGITTVVLMVISYFCKCCHHACRLVLRHTRRRNPNPAPQVALELNNRAASNANAAEEAV